jgi:hypothetical protein
VNLELDDAERDHVMFGLSAALSAERDLTRRIELIGLLKRVAALESEPEVATLDVSSPSNWYCNECGMAGPPGKMFAHSPGCAWVKRYGGG